MSLCGEVLHYWGRATAIVMVLPVSQYCQYHTVVSCYCQYHIIASITLLPISHYCQYHSVVSCYCQYHIIASITLLQVSHCCYYAKYHIIASITLLQVSHYCYYAKYHSIASITLLPPYKVYWQYHLIVTIHMVTAHVAYCIIRSIDGHYPYVHFSQCLPMYVEPSIVLLSASHHRHIIVTSSSQCPACGIDICSMIQSYSNTVIHGGQYPHFSFFTFSPFYVALLP